MPRGIALVDGVREVLRPVAATLRHERAKAEYATVEFGGGQQGLLDLTEHRSRVWAEVLDSLRQADRPAYVEIDLDTSLITQVLLPMRYRVERIQSVTGGLQVELVISHARHTLPRSHPKFRDLRRMLEDARERGSEILVTETDHHEIVDARPASGEAPPRRRSRRRR
jgi:hypothetical protein